MELLPTIWFIAIAVLEGGGNAAIRRVLVADVLASAMLLAAWVWARR